MRIVACVRLALDWNFSTKDFRIEPDTWKPVVSFPRHRIDQYDEIAVETALQTRALMPDSVVHALTLGPSTQDMALRHALGMSANKASRVDAEDAPGPSKARALASAIGAISDCSLAVMGRTGSESGSGSTGPMVAEALGWPCVTNVIAIESVDGNTFRMLRESGAGVHVVTCKGPVVVTVTNAKRNVPRAPAMKDKIRAHREPIEVIVPSGMSKASPVKIVKRHIPQINRTCRFLSGSPKEQAGIVADCIRAAMGDA